MKNVQITSKEKMRLSIVLLLAAVTLTAYWSLKDNLFISYDDVEYITQNNHIQEGLTLASLKWAFTTTYCSYWHPLTWLSHMVDIELFGLNPKGHHLVSLLIHIVNSILLFLFLEYLTGRLWPSALAAALFALHPVNVDSVAWAAERKNVLSTFFWFVSMFLYLRYVRVPSLAVYLMALLAFALGLMAKPMLVTLPFVLLLLDYWPLQRLSSCRFKQVLPLIKEKAPFFLLTMLSLAATITPEVGGGTILSVEKLSFFGRILRAVNSYAGYLSTFAFPLHLTALYPYREVWPWQDSLRSVAVLCVITAVAILRRHKSPCLLIGWLWFIGTMVPVIQLFQVGEAPVADRYVYVPFIGLYLMLAWGMDELSRQTAYGKHIAVTLSLVVLTLLWLLTYRQTGYWKDSGTLFKHAIEVTHNNYKAYTSYGTHLFHTGKIHEAREAFAKGLEIKPDDPFLNYNMWAVLSTLGRPQEGSGYLTRTLPHIKKSKKPDKYKFIAAALLQAERYDEAREFFFMALSLNRNDVDALNSIGLSYLSQDKYEDALSYFDKALAVNSDSGPDSGLDTRPDFLQSLYNKWLLLEKRGKKEEAGEILKRIMKLKQRAQQAR